MQQEHMYAYVCMRMLVHVSEQENCVDMQIFHCIFNLWTCIRVKDLKPLQQMKA